MIQVTITTAAPADPQTVTEYGDALPELVRCLNHLTQHHEALGYPADADRLVRNLALAVSRLPQLLAQVAGWVDAEEAAGRTGAVSGSPFPSPGLAARAARMRLEQAQADARILQQALDGAAGILSGLTGPGRGGEGEDRGDLRLQGFRCRLGPASAAGSVPHVHDEPAAGLD